MIYSLDIIDQIILIIDFFPLLFFFSLVRKCIHNLRAYNIILHMFGETFLPNTCYNIQYNILWVI